MNTLTKCLLSLFSLLVVGQAMAQELDKRHAVLLGVAQETRGFTLSYEHRFLPFTNGMAFAVKGFMGYGFQHQGETGGRWNFSTHLFRNVLDKPYEYLEHTLVGRHLDEYSIGMELNALFGVRKHFFESGLGLALDYFTKGVNYYSWRNDLGYAPDERTIAKTKAGKLASHHYVRVGYRYVAQSGLTFGAGLTLHQLEGLFTRFFADTKVLTPYLSAGYSF